MFNVLATCRSNIMNWSWRERIPFARFFYVSNTYKQHQVEIGKKWSKTLWLNYWQTSNKTSFLSQWDYIINCNENKNDNQKMDQDVDIETDMKNVACLRQIVSILQ